MAAADELMGVGREDCVDYVTLEIRNAVIEERVGRAEAVTMGRQLRMAILGGAGKTFCAGADPGSMSRRVGYDHEKNVHDAWAPARLFARLDTIADLRVTTEAREGMRTFLGKRPASWIEDEGS